MPNKRAPGQKLLTFQASEKFEKVINSALESHRELGTRSEFIRAAIVERLQRLGQSVPPDLYSAPSRIGKGGAQTRTKYPAKDTAGYVLNEANSSRAEPEGIQDKAVSIASAYVQKRKKRGGKTS